MTLDEIATRYRLALAAERERHRVALAEIDNEMVQAICVRERATWAVAELGTTEAGDG